MPNIIFFKKNIIFDCLQYYIHRVRYKNLSMNYCFLFFEFDCNAYGFVYFRTLLHTSNIYKLATSKFSNNYNLKDVINLPLRFFQVYQIHRIQIYYIHFQK